LRLCHPDGRPGVQGASEIDLRSTIWRSSILDKSKISKSYPYCVLRPSRVAVARLRPVIDEVGPVNRTFRLQTWRVDESQWCRAAPNDCSCGHLGARFEHRSP